MSLHAQKHQSNAPFAPTKTDHSSAVNADGLIEITGLINAYFDLLYFCDLDLFDQVFHPKAIYATADETPILHRDMGTYREVLAKRQSPASRHETRRDAIDEVQLAGENTAFVRVRCTIGDTDFVDFLTLVRTDGQWKIMAKIFQIVEKN